MSFLKWGINVTNFVFFEQKIEFHQNFDALKNKHAMNEFFWANIQSSFHNSIVKGHYPSIILFVFDDEELDFAENLVQEIFNVLQHKILKKTVSYNFFSLIKGKF